MISPARLFRHSARATLLATILVAAGLLTSCSGNGDWVLFRGQGGRGYTSDNIRPPIGIKWKLQLQTDGSTAFAFNNFVIRKNVMYFGSTDGNFYAMDLETGYMKWVFKTGAPVNSIPYADNKNVYFGSNDGNVYAVSRSDGKKVWAYFTGRTVQSTVVRYKNFIIASSDGGSLFFLNLDGKLVNEIQNPVWHRDTFQVYDDVIYLARGPVSNPRTLGAYDLKTDSYNWLLDASVLNADWYSFPAIAGNRVFISTCTYFNDHWQYDYYAFHRQTGQILWHYNDQSVFGNDPPADLYNALDRNLSILDFMAPAVWNNRVIYASGDTILRAFDTHSGALAWSHQFNFRTTSAPMIAGDRVYVGVGGDTQLTAPPNDGKPQQLNSAFQPSGKPVSPRLVCLSARNGKVIWQMNIDGALLSPPVVAGKWIVFGTDKNFVYVLEELI
ncbi:MAG TPA: PQQ-binding-like beta-propeller repeat protein [Spirochaetia bacterium]|nr:PQQ-binding-like beta-propeller repeat protein [Spirochaetia bacterium]